MSIGWTCELCERWKRGQRPSLFTLAHAAKRIGVKPKVLHNAIARFDLDVIHLDGRPFVHGDELERFSSETMKGGSP